MPIHQLDILLSGEGKINVGKEKNSQLDCRPRDMLKERHIGCKSKNGTH